MYKLNKSKVALASTLILLSSVALAQSSTEEIGITLTVSSGFSFTEVAPLAFGTIRATQAFTAGNDQADGLGTAVPGVFDTNQLGAGLTINADGTAPTTVPAGALDTTGADPAQLPTVNSVMTSIVAGTAGEYLLSGAAPDTDMTVTAPASSFPLSDGTTNAFTATITLADMIVSTGPNAGLDLNTSVARTDGAGAATILVGGTINIAPTINGVIEDGTYTGDYTITVSY